jgi:hypothetical protein
MWMLGRGRRLEPSAITNRQPCARPRATRAGLGQPEKSRAVTGCCKGPGSTESYTCMRGVARPTTICAPKGPRPGPASSVTAYMDAFLLKAYL